MLCHLIASFTLVMTGNVSVSPDVKKLRNMQASDWQGVGGMTSLSDRSEMKMLSYENNEFLLFHYILVTVWAFRLS